MAHSYTPGLKVTASTTLRRERKLPLPGDVLVQVGQRVSASDIVARTQLPGNVQAVNVANLLGVLPEDVEEFLTKPVGSHVEKGEVFAESKSFFGLFRSKCHAPVQGSIESVSKVTGQVLLREEPIPVEVDAYVDGTIVEVHPRSGVTVETKNKIEGVDLVVIDSLEALDVLAKFQDRRSDLFHFFQWLRDLGTTTFVLTEAAPEAAFPALEPGQNRDDAGYLADGIVHLKLHPLSDVEMQRRVRISKLRGSNHKTGFYALLFEAGRFSVTPAMSA